MKRLIRVWVMTPSLIALFAWFGMGQALAAVTVDEIKKELGLSVYLQGAYMYNFANPEDNNGNLGRWEPHPNSFTLDLAELQFLKEATKGTVGYKVKLIAGDFAKTMNKFGIGISSESSNDAFDVMEAYVEYLAPVGSGLKVRFGRMGTFHGAEVIEARDNPTYSRSFLFVFAEPLTHTGVSATYTFSDTLNAGVHLVNGWDDAQDNNRGKTVGLNINYAPLETVSGAFNFMYGPEQANQDGHNRFLFTAVVTMKPLKPASVILAVDYGKEKKAVPGEDGDLEDATWYGAAATGKYDVNDAWSVAARGEYFNDKDGARTGKEQKLKEITLAAEWRVASGLTLKPEYRHDWSDEKVFYNSDTEIDKKTQDTVALGATYTW